MGSKRGNGEGNIYHRKDGRWETRMSLPDGKRKSFFGKTRQDAARKLAEATRDRDKGMLPVPQKETVGQFLMRWLESSAKPSVRPATHESYSDLIRLHLVPELGRHRLAQLSPQHVQDMMGRKLAAGLSPRRVQYMRSVLRVALNQALRWGLVVRNVATLVESPRVVSPEVNPLTPEQARMLLEAMQGDRLETLYSVVLAVGLRQGEALGLRWQNVDLDVGTLRVAVSLQRIKGEYQLVEPKSPRSKRTILLPKMAVAALRAHRKRQLEEQLRAGAEWENWGLVFTTVWGRPLHGSVVTHRFQRLLYRAGLRHMRFHDLRHACASLLLAQGVSPRMIMEILGHSQISLTMNLYSHILPSMHQDAASRMDAVLGVGV